jgi:glutathione S-transferase
MTDEALLYDVSDSPFCIKARICLQLKEVPYRRVTVTVARAVELRRLNPKGQVPVLVDGSEVVPDSSAIARYLELHYPTPALIPSDPAARAYCALIEEWADEVLYWIVGALKWQAPSNREVALRTVDEIRGNWPRGVVLRALRWQIGRRLAALRLDARRAPDVALRLKENLGVLVGLLGERDFVLGRQPTLADVAVFAQVAWLRPYVEWTLVRDTPSVAAWVDRMLAIPAVRAALPS